MSRHDRETDLERRINDRPALVADPALLALAPFLASAIVYPPNLHAFSAAACSYDAPGACSLVALATALACGVALAVASAAHPGWRGLSRGASVACACAYVASFTGVVALLALGGPTPAQLACSGVLGVTLVLVVLSWVRRFAGNLRNSMLYGAVACAVSALLSWVASTLPAPAAAACLVAMAAVGALAPAVARPGGGEAQAGRDAAPTGEGGLVTSLRSMLSVIWLPLLGFLVFIFMVSAYQFPTDAPAMRTEFVAALLASALALGLVLARPRTPLVILVDKLVVPVCVAVCIVLGSFPAGSPLFLLGARTVLAPLMFLAIYALSALVAMSAAGEFPQPFIVGVGVTSASAVGLVAALVAQAFRDQANFGQVTWVAVVLYCAVVVVWLGWRGWRRETACAPAVPGVDAGAEDLLGRLAGEAAGGEPDAAAHMVDVILARRVSAVAAEHGLTDRETEILANLVRGYSSTYIAQCLLISANTVRTHMRNIYRKLGVSSRSELLELVGRHG